MYHGDLSRKKILIDYGFRLEAAYDNRPLKFYEFMKLVPKIVFLSATPGEYEIEKSKPNVIEQLVRPTGIIDPKITIKPITHQVIDLLTEIKKTIKNNGRILVTTITKRNAEDLTDYLMENNIKAGYLHADVKTLDRHHVLSKLRTAEYDVLVGINLLREGLDLPEVKLIAILDADKEGFLRDRRSLIQIMGRAARNVEGRIIIYADKITRSIETATAEIDRRREYQVKYNQAHRITPQNIVKTVRPQLAPDYQPDSDQKSQNALFEEININIDSLTPYDKKKLVIKLEKEMKQQARNLNFERAIEIREFINRIWIK